MFCIALNLGHPVLRPVDNDACLPNKNKTKTHIQKYKKPTCQTDAWQPNQSFDLGRAISTVTTTPLSYTFCQCGTSMGQGDLAALDWTLHNLESSFNAMGSKIENDEPCRHPMISGSFWAFICVCVSLSNLHIYVYRPATVALVPSLCLNHGTLSTPSNCT